MMSRGWPLQMLYIALADSQENGSHTLIRRYLGSSGWFTRLRTYASSVSAARSNTAGATVRFMADMALASATAGDGPGPAHMYLQSPPSGAIQPLIPANTGRCYSLSDIVMSSVKHLYGMGSW